MMHMLKCSIVENYAHKLQHENSNNNKIQVVKIVNLMKLQL